ncbi:MAG: DUF393 domain-containing protein [Acidimicrobiaceae bacterium]|nr:DUF393 domain-containing protein [Acidimicrobiaceae bacterium]
MNAIDRPVLIFDGDCGLCTSAAHWVCTKSVPSLAPVLVASQSLDAQQLAALSLSRSDVERAAWWIEGGYAYDGHRALAKALTSCEGPWRVAGELVGRRPLRWLAAAVYPVVVRYRYVLSRGPVRCTRMPETSL